MGQLSYVHGLSPPKFVHCNESTSRRVFQSVRQASWIRETSWLEGVRTREYADKVLHEGVFKGTGALCPAEESSIDVFKGMIRKAPWIHHV